ncbi:MAG: hypothetical protein JSR82_02270 [Verrucomicrobia bacterium]|nr:hypothetical protein [Verrucomicrobiota bacterium]
MTFSGLLLTLNSDDQLAEAALAELARHPAVTLGPRRERWQAVALEVADGADSRAAHDWLLALPGVDYVDVVSVHFEPEPLAAPLAPAHAA